MESALRIDLRPNVKPIIKAVLSLRGFLMLLIGLGALHTGISFLQESLLVAIICIAAFVLFIFIAKKFLEQVFFSEYIILNANHISIFYKTFLQEKQQNFKVDEVIYFGFAGRQEYTQHPMHNDFVDVTGLEATEKELQYVIDIGTLEITSLNSKYRFGKNIASWEAEEIIEKVENFYQRKFNTNEKTQ